MKFATYADFTALYGDELPETDFNRLSWEAEKKVNYYTTGIDGLKKLVYAFPEDEDDIEAIRRCVCELVYTAWQIQKAEDEAARASGYIETANGLQGKVVSSVSAGNESISFATGGSGSVLSRYAAAVSDATEREHLTYSTIMLYLRGARDRNGVNLLYMGEYPIRLRKEQE